jgi:hypothetical protein
MVEFFMALEDIPMVSARTGGERSSVVVARKSESNRGAVLTWPNGLREDGSCICPQQQGRGLVCLELL